jgi:5-methyltetrahydropteroyltriglutamate--homocysteine methyltransferase
MADWQELPLVTTVVGSYPTDGLPRRRAVQRAVEDQIAAGIDVIADGQVRGDMVTTFAEQLPGYRQADDGHWEVYAALDRPAMPIAAADYALARRIAAGRATVKGVVTGPITLALASQVAPDAPYFAPHDPNLILRLAELLAHEVAALVAAGADVVQVDEPALATALGRQVPPELAENALRDLAALPALPILHVCGDVRSIADELLALSFAALDLEGTRLDNLTAIDRDALEFAGARLCYGCVDTQSQEVEPVAIVRERVRVAMRAVGPERLWLSPDCGLRNLSQVAARGKLATMVAAVRDVRAEL